jgi:hypothetical protein
MIREFNFFLDAWLFCYGQKVDWKKAIQRRDWDTWTVSFEKNEDHLKM